MSNADTLTVDQALQQAIAHHCAGQLQDAERLYRAILQAQPQHPDANHNLGVLAVGVGQAAVALPFFKAALAANPRAEQFWASYTDALIRLGHHKPVRKAIDAARRQGVSAKTITAIKTRLKTAVGSPSAATQSPPLPAAQPDRQAQEALIALYEQRRFVELEAAARGMVRDYPACDFGWEVLPLALKKQHRYTEAITAYRQALQRNPGSTMTLSNLSNCLINLSLYEEAIIHAKHALAIDKNHVTALINIGVILRQTDRDEEAKTYIDRALLLKPDHPCALRNRAQLLTKTGFVDDAKTVFQRACDLAPNDINCLIPAALLLPQIPKSRTTITDWRERYRNGIGSLSAYPTLFDEQVGNLSANYFELAYHDADDRPIVEALCRLFRAKSPVLNFVAPHLADWWSPTDGRRLRIGFCSRFLVTHTIGKLYQGLLTQLDRARFEVTLIHGPEAKRDAFSKLLDRQIEHVMQLPRQLAAQQQMLAEARLDVLFYPDIGMSPATYFLAYARLAPVQVVSWGHPDTTGIDTLDYFVSAKNIEPEDADAHYSERLIRLNRLPCYYQPFQAPTRIPSRAALGLPQTGTLYGCPQSLFKFHPDFDVVLAEIASGDPDGHIVVLDGMVANWNVLLHERWAKSAPILNERVIFLPRVPLDRFMALMAHFDVLLDPLHFGSGNTLYEAMVYGTPIVTWPGRFMRGRIVAGAYRQMGLADAPIAERIEDYAPLALAMGRDQARRQAFRKNCLAAAATNLFADLRAVREFETFLEAAVAAAGRGEKLPENWCVTAAGASA